VVVAGLVRRVEVAVAAPVLGAAAVGAAVAALWLRFRARVRGGRGLGAVGRPEAAVAAAAALVVAGSLGQLLLPKFLALLVYVLLDAVALVWLRQVLHLGLMEEAVEHDVGPDIVCANCGHDTPAHTFCSNCGISLQALPKAKGPGPGAHP